MPGFYYNVGKVGGLTIACYSYSQVLNPPPNLMFFEKIIKFACQKIGMKYKPPFLLNHIKKYEKITQIPIIPAVNGYQNFGILFGFEFEKKPFLFSFGIMPVIPQK